MGGRRSRDLDGGGASSRPDVEAETTEVNPGESVGFCSSKLAELLTAQAYKEGVLISAGTDSFAPAEDPYPALQGEIEILVNKVGMTPMDALRSATLISAMSMGQQTDMGTLESGKLANIVFLSANPLEDIAAIRQVASTVKRGVQYQRKKYVPVTKAEVEGHL